MQQLILFVLSDLVTNLHALTAGCPIQCHCVPSRMNCEVPGLKQLPAPSVPQLEYMLVENQTFDRTHLGPTELKIYESSEFGGHVRLKHLYIRSCNIRTIGQQAFQRIGTHLEILDLSGNPLGHVADYAFAGLRQLTLILDKLDRPVFENQAFSGLTKMKSLIMQHSNLETLPYEPLLHLTLDGNLDSLLVRGNRLRTLDSKFDGIFRTLHSFNINENPWHCDCRLNWLIHHYRVLAFTRAHEVGTDSKRWTISSNRKRWTQEESQPQCASPPSFAGLNFSDLITDIDEVYSNALTPAHAYNRPKVLHCPHPKLKSLDISFGNYNRFDPLTDHPLQTPVDDEALSIQIKCVMSGSEQLTIVWRYGDPKTGFEAFIDESAVHTQQRPVSDVEPWNDRPKHGVLTESQVKMEQNNQTDTYICLGQDIMGNVSTLLRIRWPAKSFGLPSYSQSPSNSFSSNNTRNDPSMDIITNISSNSHSSFHTPQFSLSHLLAVIVATFLCTVLLFIFVHLTSNLDSDVSNAQIQTNKLDANLAATSSFKKSFSSSSWMSLPNPNGNCPKLTSAHVRPESLSITLTLLNANAYHYLLNRTFGVGYPIIPPQNESVKLTSVSKSQTTDSQRAQSHLVVSNAVTTRFGNYETLLYSNANNSIYDVPSQGVSSSTWSTLPIQEQRTPLLYPMISNIVMHQTNAKVVRNPGFIQPSLEVSSNALEHVSLPLQ